MTSRPHRLKKTSSMQSKRRDLHHTWLHRETNEKLSFYFFLWFSQRSAGYKANLTESANLGIYSTGLLLCSWTSHTIAISNLFVTMKTISGDRRWTSNRNENIYVTRYYNLAEQKENLLSLTPPFQSLTSWIFSKTFLIVLCSNSSICNSG